MERVEGSGGPNLLLSECVRALGTILGATLAIYVKTRLETNAARAKDRTGGRDANSRVAQKDGKTVHPAVAGGGRRRRALVGARVLARKGR